MVISVRQVKHCMNFICGLGAEVVMLPCQRLVKPPLRPALPAQSLQPIMSGRTLTGRFLWNFGRDCWTY